MLLIGKSKFRDTHRSVSKQVLCMTRSSADSHLACSLVCLSSCGIAELSRVDRLCGDSRASANRGAGGSLRCCHGLRQEFHIESGNNADYRGCSRQQRSHGDRLPSELRADGVGRRLGVARSKGSPDRRPRARRRVAGPSTDRTCIGRTAAYWDRSERRILTSPPARPDPRSSSAYRADPLSRVRALQPSTTGGSRVLLSQRSRFSPSDRVGNHHGMASKR